MKKIIKILRYLLNFSIIHGMAHGEIRKCCGSPQWMSKGIPMSFCYRNFLCENSLVSLPPSQHSNHWTRRWWKTCRGNCSLSYNAKWVGNSDQNFDYQLDVILSVGASSSFFIKFIPISHSVPPHAHLSAFCTNAHREKTNSISKLWGKFIKIRQRGDYSRPTWHVPDGFFPVLGGCQPFL